MAHPLYPVGHNGFRPMQIPMTWTEQAAAPNAQPVPSQVSVTHNAAMQATRDLPAVQARSSGQYNPTFNTPSVPRGSATTSQNSMRTKMYNLQVSLSAQLQTAHSRLRTTQSQLEVAQSEARRSMAVTQALQAKI
ncbi:hypothetical protein KEM54_002263, partial [Ascosphaera aggregata]